MSVETEKSVKNHAVTPGVTEYSFDFKILDSDAMQVTHVDDEGVEEVLDPDDYIVSGIGTDAGIVTLDTALTEGILSLERIEEYTTDTIIIEGSLFPATAIRTITDRLVMMIQQLKERDDRTLRTPMIEDAASLVLPNIDTRALNYLMFDAAGNVGVSSGLPSVAVSTFMTSFVAELTAAAGLARLGLSATAAELNTLDGITADVNELNTLDGITADVNELNTLDGVAADTEELNYAADQSARQSTIASVNYTILDTDPRFFIVTTGASDRTITLPTAADNIGRVIKIMKVDSGVGYCIVNGEGAETINGTLTWEITEQYGFIQVESDGTEWYVVNKNVCTIYRDEDAYDHTLSSSFASQFSFAQKAGTYRINGKYYVYNGPISQVVVTIATAELVEDSTEYTTGLTADSGNTSNPGDTLTIQFVRRFTEDVTLHVNCKGSLSGTQVLNGTKYPTIVVRERIA